jgi:hypothetical protein
MRALPLLLALSAAAAEPSPAYRPPYELVFENGVRVSDAPKVMRALRSLHGKYPGLFETDILQAVVFASPERGLGNVHYCREGGGEGTPCASAPARSILIDLDQLLALKDKFPGFWREGEEIEAVMFHELLHGWAYAHPAAHAEYLALGYDGRVSMFERDKHKLYKKIWALEAKIGLARWELEQAPEGGPERAAAEAALTRAEGRMESYRDRFRRRVYRYTRKRDIPRRGDLDPHAVDDGQEWFAYGGEIAFYAADPEGLLNAEERAWWAAFGPRVSVASK